MQANFGVRPISGDHHELTAAIYLQVSIISQALIFVTRSRSWSYVERPGLWLVAAFFLAQLVRVTASVLLIQNNYLLTLSSCFLNIRLLVSLPYTQTGTLQESEVLVGDGQELSGSTV